MLGSHVHTRHAVAAGEAGFTLIEMVVVVAIIGILLAIALPVSTGVLKSSQSDATRATFETLRTAIDIYQTRRPAQGLAGTYDTNYEGLFGRFPPSPTSPLTSAIPAAAKWGFTLPEAPRTVEKFAGDGTSEPGLLGAYLGAQLIVPKNANPPEAFYLPHAQAYAAARQYPSIECLIVFLRTYSPEARAIVDRLGSALTNSDADAIDRNGDGVPEEQLYEVRDSWGNVVQYNCVAEPVVGGRVYKWELRSAGPDKMFMAPFADESLGDDVVVSDKARW